MKHEKAIEFLKKVFPKGYGEVFIDSVKLDQRCFTHYDPEVEAVWRMIEDYEECSVMVEHLKGLDNLKEM